MPFPLQAQSAARATGSVGGGGRAGDVGRVGPGGAANSGRGLPLLARPQPPLSGPDFRNLRVVVGGTPCAIARADRRGAPDLSK